MAKKSKQPKPGKPKAAKASKSLGATIIATLKSSKTELTQQVKGAKKL